MSKPAVLTNLSGGGARLFMRWLPDAEILSLSISAPDPFIEEWAMRRAGRLKGRNAPVFSDPFSEACDQLRAGFADVEIRLAKSSIHYQDERGPIYALAVSFIQPSDGCYRLVHYLERQALQRGVQDLAPNIATAA